MKNCDMCGKANPEEASYCLSCGTKLEPKPEPRCPACRHINPRDARYCGSCRAFLPSWSSVAAPTTPVASPPPAQYSSPPADSAVSHIWDLSDGRSLESAAASPRPPVSLVISGVFLLVAGVIAMASGVYNIAVAGSFNDMDTGLGIIDLSGYIVCCGLLSLVFGIAGVVGGYFTLIIQRWNLALLGAILVMLAIGPYFICLVLGLIALIFIAIERDSFLT